MGLPGADANPYLALAAVLASMNDGLTRKLDPGAPVRRDGYSDTDTLEKVKQQPLPGTLDVAARALRSEEHTSELQSLMRISYAVFCLKKKKQQKTNIQ